MLRINVILKAVCFIFCIRLFTDKRRRADGGTNGEITSDSENKGEEYYEKAMQHVRQHRWQEAMEAFDKAIELGCSHMAEAYEYRGSFHFLCASTDKALADLNKALELKPDFTRAHLKKATIYMEQSEFGKRFPVDKKILL